jgi:uncharacterized membrane protein (UPF0127 family)
MHYFNKLKFLSAFRRVCTFQPKRVNIALSFILVLLSVRVHACPFDLPVATVSVEGHSLEVELSTTPKARICGLSNRVQLSDNRGMLFIYPTPGPRNFWMKDTFIPLSIAFLDDSGRILSIHQMAPMQTDERYQSLQPVRYALEVNQGWFADHGVRVGSTVRMKLPLVIEIR